MERVVNDRPNEVASHETCSVLDRLLCGPEIGVGFPAVLTKVRAPRLTGCRIDDQSVAGRSIDLETAVLG